MIGQHIRLSRISHPRGNLWAVILLITVFMSFGVVAQVCLHDAHDLQAGATVANSELPGCGHTATP